MALELTKTLNAMEGLQKSVKKTTDFWKNALSNTFEFIRAKSAGLDLVKRTYGSLFRQMDAMGKTNIDLAANLKETAKETVDVADSFNQVRDNLDFIADIPMPPTGIEKFMEAIGKLKPAVIKGLSTTFKVFKTIPLGIAGGILKFIELLNKFVPIMDIVNGLVEIFGASVAEALMPAFQAFADLLLDPAIIQMITLLGEAFGKILAVGLGLLSRALQALIDSGVFELIIAGLEWFISILDVVIGNLDNIWNAIVGGVTWFIDLMTNIFTGIWEGIVTGWTTIAAFFTRTWEIILAGIRLVINGIIFVINTVIDGLNALDIADVFTDIPRVPMLADGVPMVTSPTLAIVGERGPEGVFPINDRGAAMAAAVFGGGTTNNTRNVTTNVQATVFGEEQMEELTRRIYVENTLNGRR
jgi:phage-related protein